MALEVFGLLGPAERRERPQRRREPRVEDVVILPQRLVRRFATRLLLALSHKHLTVLGVPRWNPVTPPQLARDAPRLDVLEPVEPRFLPGLWDDLDIALARGFEHR